MARRSDHSREEIHDMALEAATRILVAEGYRALTARRIAREIGYTVGTLYLVFDNLNGLLLEINGSTLREIHACLAVQVEQAQSPPEQLRGLCQAYYQYAQDNRARWQLLFEREIDAVEHMPEWYTELVRQGFLLVEAVLSGILQTSTPSDLADAAKALWGSIHGISLLALTGKLDITQAGEAERLIDIVVDHVLST